MNDIVEIEELKTVILLKKNDEKVIGVDASEIDDQSVVAYPKRINLKSTGNHNS